MATSGGDTERDDESPLTISSSSLSSCGAIVEGRPTLWKLASKCCVNKALFILWFFICRQTEKKRGNPLLEFAFRVERCRPDDLRG